MAVLNGVSVNCCLYTGALTHTRSTAQMSFSRNRTPKKATACFISAAPFLRTPKGGGFLEAFL